MAVHNHRSSTKRLSELLVFLSWRFLAADHLHSPFSPSRTLVGLCIALASHPESKRSTIFGILEAARTLFCVSRKRTGLSIPDPLRLSLHPSYANSFVLSLASTESHESLGYALTSWDPRGARAAQSRKCRGLLAHELCCRSERPH